MQDYNNTDEKRKRFTNGKVIQPYKDDLSEEERGKMAKTALISINNENDGPQMLKEAA